MKSSNLIVTVTYLCIRVTLIKNFSNTKSKVKIFSKFEAKGFLNCHVKVMDHPPQKSVIIHLRKKNLNIK